MINQHVLLPEFIRYTQLLIYSELTIIVNLGQCPRTCSNRVRENKEDKKGFEPGVLTLKEPLHFASTLKIRSPLSRKKDLFKSPTEYYY